MALHIMQRGVPLGRHPVLQDVKCVFLKRHHAHVDLEGRQLRIVILPIGSRLLLHLVELLIELLDQFNFVLLVIVQRNLCLYFLVKFFDLLHQIFRSLIIFVSQLQAGHFSLPHVVDEAGEVRKVWLLYALALHMSVVGSYHTGDIEHILDFLKFLRQVLTIFALIFITPFHDEVPHPVFQHINVICGLLFRPCLQSLLYSLLHFSFIFPTNSGFPLDGFLALSLYDDNLICEMVF